MNLLEKQLRALSDLFNQTKTKYAILGGLAVIVYGEPRLTADIDVNVSIAKEKIDAFLKTAKKIGFYPVPKNINSFIKKTGIIPLRFGKNKTLNRCDIIMAVNSLEFMALKRAKIKKFGSLRLRFISPEDLVIHKMVSDRQRDIEDARSILLRQRGKLDMKYILYWLKKIAKVNKKPALLEMFKKMLKV